MQKVTYAGNVGQVVDAVDFSAKGQTHTVDAVNIGGGDFVFGAKRSDQWVQWTQWNRSIWWWGHCLWCKKVKPVDTVCSEPVDTVDAKNSDMHPEDGVNAGYAVNSEHYASTASTVSTGLTFLHQRQCPHHHITTISYTT